MKCFMMARKYDSEVYSFDSLFSAIRISYNKDTPVLFIAIVGECILEIEKEKHSMASTYLFCGEL